MKKLNRNYEEILKKIKEVEEKDGISIYGDTDRPLTKEDLMNMEEKELINILLFVLSTDDYEPYIDDTREDKIKKTFGIIDDLSMLMNVNFYDGSLGKKVNKDEIMSMSNEELDEFLADCIILMQQVLDDLEASMQIQDYLDIYDEAVEEYKTMEMCKVNESKSESGKEFKLPTPKEMSAELDKRIFGNEDVKKKLTTAIYRKLVTIEINKGKTSDILDTPNILLCGATGTSKTYSVKCIADMLGIPVYTINASQLTPSSYKGTGVNEEIYNIVTSRTYRENEPKIIFFDEIDKLAGFTDDAKEIGTLVMGEMLKLMEAKGEVTLSAGVGGRQTQFNVNFDNVIFIFAGAFDGITKIVKQRRGETKKAPVGFGIVGLNDSKVVKDSTEGSLYKQVTKEDLKEYGLTPEFLGRIGTVCITDAMTTDMMLNILEKQNSALAQNVELLKFLGKELVITKEGKEVICDKALKSGYGARSLSEELFKIVSEVLYNLDNYGDTIEINEELLENINYI